MIGDRSSYLGFHSLIDFHQCTSEILKRTSTIEQIMVEAAKAANLSIVSQAFNQFEPHGVSGFLVLKESHFSIHTWPEHSCAAVDLFTCGSSEGTLAISYLRTALEAKQVNIKEINRLPMGRLHSKDSV